jgi:hypothetical protein
VVLNEPQQILWPWDHQHHVPTGRCNKSCWRKNSVKSISRRSFLRSLPLHLDDSSNVSLLFLLQAEHHYAMELERAEVALRVRSQVSSHLLFPQAEIYAAARHSQSKHRTTPTRQAGSNQLSLPADSDKGHHIASSLSPRGASSGIWLRTYEGPPALGTGLSIKNSLTPVCGWNPGHGNHAVRGMAFANGHLYTASEDCLVIRCLTSYVLYVGYDIVLN